METTDEKVLEQEAQGDHTSGQCNSKKNRCGENDELSISPVISKNTFSSAFCDQCNEFHICSTICRLLAVRKNPCLEHARKSLSPARTQIRSIRMDDTDFLRIFITYQQSIIPVRTSFVSSKGMKACYCLTEVGFLTYSSIFEPYG